jgi:hypothetical protein
MPAGQLGVFRFFCTNALGLMFEQRIASLYRKVQGHDENGSQRTSGPAWYIRAAGYVWVIAFMTWTGPSWIYPQAVRAPPVQASAAGPTAFLPFSVIGWLKG